MDGQTVATMLKETTHVYGGDRRDRHSQSLGQSFAASSLHFAQQSLDLGEGFFDKIEIRRVRWQVQKLAALLFDQRPHPLSLVSRKIIYHHNLTFAERGRENLLQVSIEDCHGLLYTSITPRQLRESRKGAGGLNGRTRSEEQQIASFEWPGRTYPSILDASYILR